MTTTGYRAGGADMSIRFSTGECSLGALLVACTKTGVCSILLADTPLQLIRDLKTWVPKAEIAGPEPSLDRLTAAATLLVENPASRYELPLDVHGTAFQLRVWKLLRSIPPGVTETYTDLALRVGRPGAVRSVWQAVHTNPLAVAVPCHRIIHANGNLGGCRWGVARQSELLAREARIAGEGKSHRPINGIG
jgi:AraC family transcriptional regulator of adaptative response/methylated-DNA-[protein]-cysteine methyltransferase